MPNTEKAIKATYFSIVGNTALALIKGITGYFGNSYAMIADAIESTTDIFASFLVLFGIKYSNKPADENHPYGHGRAEPLITFLVVGFLIISATIIAYESINNIGTPHELPKPFTLFVLGAIILWKEISFQIVMKKSIETKSSSLKADAWHHRSDAITSVAAFVGIRQAVREIFYHQRAAEGIIDRALEDHGFIAAARDQDYALGASDRRALEIIISVGRHERNALFAGAN